MEIMNQYNFPTVIYFGENSIQSLPNTIQKEGATNILIITDQGLVNAGIAELVRNECVENNLRVEVFSDIHSNPLEEDVLKARQFFIDGKFEAIIGLGGGSAMDVAKTVKFLVVHDLPLAQFDVAKG